MGHTWTTNQNGDVANHREIFESQHLKIFGIVLELYPQLSNY